MTTDLTTTSLHDRIAELMASIATQVPPALLASLGTELENLAATGIARHALTAGAAAPEWTLPDARGGAITLSTLRARGPVALVFYRGGWCPFCNLQLRAYQQVLREIRALGAELVAISPQTADFAAADLQAMDLTFPVLHDAHNEVARRYGLVFKLSDAMQQLQIDFGNPPPKFNGDDSWELPMPGVFVIDRAGMVTLAHVDPDFTKRFEPAALLDALRRTAS